MRWFLDMNIPVYYSFNIGDRLEKNTKRFVECKNDSTFLLCDYIKSQNIPKWIKRYETILLEFKRIIYKQEESVDLSILFPQDKIVLDRILSMYEQSKNKNKTAIQIIQIFSMLRIKINLFLKQYIDEVVISVRDIDFKLKSCLFTWLHPNDSDAKTIASAIQEHNNKLLTIITSDKHHWTKELLEEVHNDVFLKKKYPSLPKIKYLQNFS